MKMKIPFNAFTGDQYSENNTVLLLQSGFVSPEWATYRQWQNIGHQVQKDEKGTRLKRVCIKERKDGSVKKYLKTFSVFNVSQTQQIEIDSE